MSKQKASIPNSITLLNRAVADEMSAVHQYLYFHFHCHDQGYEFLAKLFQKAAIDEMGHIEALSERVLFLKGDIILKASVEVKPIRLVKEMLITARQMEKESARDYNTWALECTSKADSGSKLIFEKLIGDEERHFDLFDRELANLTEFGANYLALQSMERSAKSK